jgi:hypothetical protein
MAEVKTAKAVLVELKRDHWVGTERHEAGEWIEATPKEARRLVDAGVAARTDPMPGE